MIGQLTSSGITSGITYNNNNYYLFTLSYRLILSSCNSCRWSCNVIFYFRKRRNIIRASLSTFRDYFRNYFMDRIEGSFLALTFPLLWDYLGNYFRDYIGVYFEDYFEDYLMANLGITSETTS